MLRIALVKCKIKEAKMGGTPKKNNKRKKNRTVFAPPKKSGLGIKKKEKRENTVFVSFRKISKD